MTSGKRLAIGCLLGCGGLVVLVVALLVSFGIWINRPGPLLEPERLLGEDTTGYVEWTLRLEDPGTEGFVRALIGAVQSAQKNTTQKLPSWFTVWVLPFQQRKTAHDMTQLFPLAAAWTMRAGETGDRDLHLFTLSMERLGNRMVFADWMIGFMLGRVPEVEVDRYRNEKIYSLPLEKSGRRITFFIRGADIFATSDLDTARLAVDRLALEAIPNRQPTALDRLFAETAGRGALRGALTNEHGEIARLLDLRLAGMEDAPWDALRGATLAGGLEPDGSLRARIVLEGPDEAWAETGASFFAEALGRLATFGELEPEVTARAAGERIEIDLRLADLVGTLSRHVQVGKPVNVGTSPKPAP